MTLDVTVILTLKTNAHYVCNILTLNFPQIQSYNVTL